MLIIDALLNRYATQTSDTPSASTSTTPSSRLLITAVSNLALDQVTFFSKKKLLRVLRNIVCNCLQLIDKLDDRCCSTFASCCTTSQIGSRNIRPALCSVCRRLLQRFDLVRVGGRAQSERANSLTVRARCVSVRLVATQRGCADDSITSSRNRTRNFAVSRAVVRSTWRSQRSHRRN